MSSQEHIVDADIRSLSAAISSNRLTSVDLVAKYLLRISNYDCSNTSLNSVPLINENVFNEAAAADDRQASSETRGLLDGIPFTVKDSYKVKGMTVASGSEAFENLVANEDAFTVKALRDAGSVLIGKTNMCPMAYGGMLRGLYGRAESPYNLEYLPAAFGSGSSNGSGVATSSSFAAFGMGEETVSSGRSPASNNALVAYTPSRGLISIRGNWPLYPTCDVVVPHTRTVDDLLILLQTLTTQDTTTKGDFWRDQPYIQLPKRSLELPKPFTTSINKDFLKRKRIGIPQLFTRYTPQGPYVCGDVEKLSLQLQADLEAAGAVVQIIPEIPALQMYEKLMTNVTLNDLKIETGTFLKLSQGWNSTERGPLIAHAWEDFLHDNQDPNFPSLVGIDPAKIFPQLPRDNPQVKFTEPANAVQWSKLASYVSNRSSTAQPDKSPIYDVPLLEDAVLALESMRKHVFEAWMDSNDFDFVAFPAAGDVAKSDSDVDYNSAAHAWTNGVKYSHGNRALRHLGIPSVTVPMGMLQKSKMPMGVTLIGRAYDDDRILKAAYAYETDIRKRVVPPLVPVLESDIIPQTTTMSGTRPKLLVPKCIAQASEEGKTSISVEGTLSLLGDSSELDNQESPILEIYIDGKLVPDSDIRVSSRGQAGKSSNDYDFSCNRIVPSRPKQDSRNVVVGKVARDSTMIMILARKGKGGRPSGYLKLIHSSNQ